MVFFPTQKRQVKQSESDWHSGVTHSPLHPGGAFREGTGGGEREGFEFILKFLVCLN